MPNHVCWICKANTGHRLVGEPTTVSAEGYPEGAIAGDRLVCAAFACHICNGISVAMTVFDERYIGSSLKQYLSDLPGDQFLLWRPEVGETQQYPDAPEHVGSAATEAYECNSQGHHRAAIMLARAVIEATAKGNGMTQGNLYNKIEDLATAGLIRKHIKEAAHGVRELANDMAHGDFVEPVSSEESNLVVQLMGEILDEVYGSPTRVNGLRKL